MQKFLNTVVSSSTERLYQHSLERTIVELKESAQKEREEDSMLTQGLALYIASLGTDSEKIDNVKTKEQYLLIDKAREFLAHPGKELWLVQGNAGAGKSLFGRYLERELWDKYQDGDLIPLFIPLPRIGIIEKNLINKALELKGIPKENIEKLMKKKFLFILDGYDEISGKIQLLQKCKFNEPKNWQGKVIVSSRLQYLTSHEEQLLYPKHGNDDVKKSEERCVKSYIIPFKKEQIKEYIQGFCKSSFNSIKWTIGEYEEKIEQFTEVEEFLKEPFLLFLVLCVLPTLNKPAEEGQKVIIKRINLYRAFIDSWFTSQFERIMQHARVDLIEYRQEDILNIFNNYAKDLAFDMSMKNTQVIKYGGSQGNFAKFFENQLGFQGCPLKRVSESLMPST